MASINNEDDFLIFIGKMNKSEKNEVFPKVDIIARNIQVTPDIDLLILDNENNSTIGYELKIVRFRSDWNRYDYNQIYSGIGESLLYFQYGIEKVYLIIGIEYYDTIPDEYKSKIDEKMHSLIDLFEFSNIKKYLGLQIYKIERNNIKTGERVEIRTGLSTYPSNFEDNKKLLLKKEFHYEKKCYDKIHDS